MTTNKDGGKGNRKKIGDTSSADATATDTSSDDICFEKMCGSHKKIFKYKKQR
jgi:hypothetical protein